MTRIALILLLAGSVPAVSQTSEPPAGECPSSKCASGMIYDPASKICEPVSA